ncbi:hypothetical protein [Tateyamaria sp. ANG-S1]|uniref:hypothetical protein n=1 Tax=Tateyamaria sp. ANG-S1 TaxID=1577905 RepID=UPI00057CD41C|nr:hypothetical protein [Tateyamaria sp. ANG-S1]
MSDLAKSQIPAFKVHNTVTRDIALLKIGIPITPCYLFKQACVAQLTDRDYAAAQLARCLRETHVADEHHIASSECYTSINQEPLQTADLWIAQNHAQPRLAPIRDNAKQRNAFETAVLLERQDIRGRLGLRQRRYLFRKASSRLFIHGA